MRPLTVGFAILLSACMSGPNGTQDDPNNPDATDTVALSCGNDVKAFCDKNHCDLTLAAAMLDRSLCPASTMRCGEFDVIMKMGIDTSMNFYYRSGDLVAISNMVLPAQGACLAGPQMFVAPQCATTSKLLPVCNSPK